MFTYSIVHLVPDPVRGEFINIGIIVVSDDDRSSRCEFLSGFRQKISALAPHTDSDLLEGAVQDFKLRFDPDYRPTLFGERDPRLTSAKQLQALFDVMKNQVQLSEPKPYRAFSMDDALDELFTEFVAPQAGEPPAPRNLAVWQLRELVRRTIRDWTDDSIEIRENEAEQLQWASHFAHFWLAAGAPRELLAAVITLPSEPDERYSVWALRDSVPTIANAFRKANPNFKTVVVFPANGHTKSSFVAETEAFLGPVEGVIVTRLDELASLRDEIVPALLTGFR